MDQDPKKTIIHIDGQANTVNMYNSTKKESFILNLFQKFMEKLFNLS